MYRFTDINDTKLEEMLDNRDSNDTTNVIKMEVEAFNEFSTNKSVLLSDFEMSSNAEIADLLKTKRHVQKVRQFDIINDADFKSANLISNAMVVKLKQPGYGATTRNNVLKDEDLGILYNSFAVNSSAGLQINRLKCLLILCENLRELAKTDFIFHGHGSSDNAFVQLKDHFTTNHTGGAKSTWSSLCHTPS